MKRIIFLTILILLAVTAFAQNMEAVIREMSGIVELQESGSTIWTTASVGDSIGADTIISTGFRSSAVLAIGNSTFLVRPLTRLSLESLVSRDNVETVSIGLQAGRVRVEVRPPAGSSADVGIATPSTVASVRGTEFSIDPVNIRVYEGSIIFGPVGEGRPVMVRAGQISRLDSDSLKVMNPYTETETVRALPLLAGMEAAPVRGSGSFRVRTADVVFQISLNVGL